MGLLGTDYKFTGQREEASLGLYFFVARWFDPYLNRFTQPDTIVPLASQGTQAWDRYAYANNNPVRYNDPTGHMADDGEGGGSDGCTDPEYCENGKPKTTTDDDSNDDLVETLQKVATVTQDIATGIDAVFGLIELGLGVAGCIAFVEVGCIEGAGAGLLAGDIVFNLTGANGAETFFSGVSLAATVIADGLDDGQLGDASLTSAITFGMGAAMPDPIGDFVIDGYASGYNHGIFSGIGALFNGSPFFVK